MNGAIVVVAEHEVPAARSPCSMMGQPLSAQGLSADYPEREIRVGAEPLLAELGALVFVSASRSHWIAKSGGQGGDLAIPAEQVAQTKIMAELGVRGRRGCGRDRRLRAQPGRHRRGGP